MTSRHDRRTQLLATTLAATSATVLLLAASASPARAHVDYVTERPDDPVDAVRFLLDTLADPATAMLFGASALLALAGVAAYLRFRPFAADLAVLRATLDGYRDLVPWMLRLSLGLPLVGAGFAGYFFSPSVPTDARLLQVALGFLLLFGLATRAVAALGLLTYLVGLALEPALLLAFEYVPGFVAIVLVGSGRPSADHMLAAVARTDGTAYGRVDPVNRLSTWFDERVAPAKRYVPTVLRVGLGLAFLYLGVTQKLTDPGPALSVVEKYDLTAVVPASPAAWVIGAGLAEAAFGLALVAGFLTRGTAAGAFLLFTLTLFGLPDDPVLAHVSLFGLASAVFTLGSGPLALDSVLGTHAVSPSRVTESVD